MDDRRRYDWRGEIHDHQAFLRRLARGLVADEHHAEDLVQDAWVAALRRPPGAPGALRAWFVRVIRNASANRAVQRDRRARREEEAARLERVCGPDAMEERLELERLVVEAVQSLPEPHRRAIYLRYFEDLRPAEIAVQVDAPLPTVQSRLARGRELLRKRLDRHFGGGRSAWSRTLLVMLEQANEPHHTPIPHSLTNHLLGALLMTSKTTVLAVTTVILAVALFLWQPWVPGAPTTASEIPSAAQDVRSGAGVGDDGSSPSLTEVDRGSSRAGRRVVDTREMEDRISTDRATLELTVHFASDGRPARGVRGHAQRGSAEGSYRSFTADELGKARLEDLEPGEWSVFLHAYQKASIALPAGEVTSLAMEIPPGPSLRGLVVGPDGRPVAHAEIYRSDPARRPDTWGITAADQGGRFLIPDARPGTPIGARMRGRVPSHQCRWQGRPGRSVDVVLVMGGTSTIVRGRVVDEAGRPLCGALVEAAGRHRDDFTGEDGFRREPPNISRRETDPHGTFEFDDVPPGWVWIGATAKGYQGEQQLLMERHAGSQAEVELVLGRGGGIEGVVRDEHHRPVSGARIRVETSIGGPRSALEEMRRLGATTDERGTFRIEGIPAETVKATALHPAAGRAETFLEVQPGASQHWEVELVAGQDVHGRVLDERGAPLVAWDVAVNHSEAPGERRRHSTTDENGYFHLRNCPPGTTALEVRESVDGGPILILNGIFPVTESLEILVPDSRRPSAFFTGRILGEGEEPVPVASLVTWFENEHGGRPHDEDLDPAGFRVGPLRPGLHRIRISSPRCVEHMIEGVEVAPGQTLDLGPIHLKAGGFLEVELLDAGGRRQTRERSAHLVPADGTQARKVSVVKGHWRSHLLAAGSYSVLIGGDGAAYSETRAAIEAGSTNRVTIIIAPGVDRRFRLQTVETVAADPITIEILDAAGRPVPCATELHHQGSLHVRGLTEGVYRLIATSAAGRRGEHSFTIDSHTTGDATRPELPVRIR